MVKKSAPKRTQTETIQLRVTPEQKEILESAAARAEQELQKDNPGIRLGVGPWLAGLGLKEAARLGLT